MPSSAACGKSFETLCNREAGHKGSCYWEDKSAIERAIAAERERCARIAENPDSWKKLADKSHSNITVAGRAIAAAIRATTEPARPLAPALLETAYHLLAEWDSVSEGGCCEETQANSCRLHRWMSEFEKNYSLMEPNAEPARPAEKLEIPIDVDD